MLKKRSRSCPGMQAVNESSEGQLVVIDGKTLRTSYAHGEPQTPIHMINAFVCANKVVFGQVKTS